jgi:Ser/Thr protein kinase RdoA (MazF antagonist)
MRQSARHDALRQALAASPRFAALAEARLSDWPGRGIAHDHVAVDGAAFEGHAVLLRVPRLSQSLTAPADLLLYEATGFARAAPAGVTPRLFGTLPIGPDLPWGALVVERIAGPKPRLPDDMPALAATLARLHALPVPPPALRPPLDDHADAVAELWRVIDRQAAFLGLAPIAPASRRMVETELDLARLGSVPARRLAPVTTLIGADTHPGNFLMRDGRPDACVFVDLEKAAYGNPAIDLAHATLPTSTRWDPDCAAALAPADVAAFNDAYRREAAPALWAALVPWLGPLRRLTWLRTLTWCVRWTVLSREADGWSAERLAPDHRRHIEAFVAAALDVDEIEATRAEIAAFERERRGAAVTGGA